jgi:hypothetical protein
MLTPYQDRKMKICFDQMVPIEKEQKKKLKTFSKQMCVSSQNKQYEKRRGRHRIGYTYLPSQRAASCVRRAVLGSVLPWKPSNLQRESSINYHKCPNYETPTFRHLIDSPKQMNKYMKSSSKS